MSLFSELKRRNVFRVGAAYAVIGWLLIEVADTVFPRLGLPDWTVTFVIVLALLGLPLALFLAWAYELTPQGVKRSVDVEPGASVTPKTGRRIDRLILVGALGVIVLLVAERIWFAERDAGPAAPANSTAAANASAGQAGAGPEPPAAAARSDEHSIAVLPFVNMSADPDQEFFADGITEDILIRLSRIDGLRVISRTSVMRYKGTALSLPEIAAELGVTHILEGSVRRAGDQLRITSQLIRATDDTHLWAESYDRELATVFAIQTEIAEQIAAAMELRLSERERQRLAARATDDTRAYEQYLLGRAQMNRSYRDFEEVGARADQAEARFRAALEADPSYADAWAGLSWAALQRMSVEPEAAQAHYRQALEAAQRAIELAPDSATGYVWLGAAYLTQGLPEAALEQFERSARIDPDDIDLLSNQATILADQGRIVEAIRLLRRAVRISPGNADLHDQLGFIYQQVGNLSTARASYQTAWGRITPHEARLECLLAEIAVVEGDQDSARRHIARTLELEGGQAFGSNCALVIHTALRDRDAVTRLVDHRRGELEARFPLLLAQALAITGSDESLEPLLDRAQRQLVEELPRAWGNRLELLMAMIAALRGAEAQALARLEKAVAQGARGTGVFDWPVWDAIRDRPRFGALQRQVDEDLARQRAELTAADAQE